MSKNEIDEELEEVEEEEQQEESNEVSPSKNEKNEFKDIVVKECTRIIDQYIEICKKNNDELFLKMLQNEAKSTQSCINHIMNNLTSKRIFGGADSLMYEYIHEYYVDDKFTEIKDEWSNHLRSGGGATPAPGPKQQAKDEARSKITEEQKQKFYEDALAEAKRAAELKAQEDLRKTEEKRKAKEKALVEKKKAEELAKKEAEKAAKEEAKRKAEEEANDLTGGLFDFL